MERRWLSLARSEFRWNKKRKHYSYLHKDIGSKRLNILITSKPVVVKHLDDEKVIVIKKNIPLYKHPNSNKNGKFYIIPKNYLDESNSFDSKVYKWNWNVKDKRKVKRVKKNKWK